MDARGRSKTARGSCSQRGIDAFLRILAEPLCEFACPAAYFF